MCWTTTILQLQTFGFRPLGQLFDSIESILDRLGFLFSFYHSLSDCIFLSIIAKQPINHVQTPSFER